MDSFDRESCDEVDEVRKKSENCLTIEHQKIMNFIKNNQTSH